MAKPKPVKRAKEPQGLDAPALEAAFGLLEQLPVPMFFKSRDGRYLGVNRAWEELFGIPRERFLGKQVRDLYPQNPEIAALHAARDRELWQRPGSQSYQIPIVTPDGRRRETIYCKSTWPALLPPGGEPEGLVGAIFDVTSRSRAEAALRESEERFRQTFELAASGICHVIDGRFVRVNRSLCETLGYSEQELLGKHVKELSHPEDRDVTDAGRARIRSGEIESARFEKRYIRGDDGAVVWTEIAIALARDARGEPLYEIAVFDDVTERKQAEADLQRAHEDLKRSNAELEQFAYVASHDLQEPLRMVASYTQLLARRYESKFDADAREFMAYIVDGAARMKQLIEDLLAYSRVGTKGDAFRPLPLEAPLRKALLNLRAAIEEAGAGVTYDALPTLEVDEVQMVQLLQNLIGNALKFRSASVPRVHVSAKESGREWEFEVRDNGIGIQPQYFERIFMVFQRLHNKGEYPGTGIGLAICKKVVERHGGRIWVESRAAQGEGQGSSFHFTLPKSKGEA